MGIKVKISCPRCGFSRDVPEERLPKGATVATCPKCNCRFRLQKPQEPVPDTRQIPFSADSGNREENEEEDIRLRAKRAYEAEATRFTSENSHGARQKSWNPWDMAPGKAGWFEAFYQTVVRIMFAAPRFFVCLRPDAAKGRAFIFFLLVSLIQSIVEQFWSGLFISMLTTSATNDPQLDKIAAMLSNNSNMFLTVILRCGFLAFQLYIFSFLIFIAYRALTQRRATFSLVFQIMAYSSAPALLCVVPILGSVAGWVWSLACLLIGCKSALDLDWPRALAGLLPLMAIFVPVFIQLFGMMRQ